MCGRQRWCRWAMVRFSPEAVGLLPGLWVVTFSLGIFASCRHLPPHIVVVATYYLLAGVACRAMAREAHALSPWAMAGTFGVGQLLTAAVLYLGLERRHAAWSGQPRKRPSSMRAEVVSFLPPR